MDWNKKEYYNLLHFHHKIIKTFPPSRFCFTYQICKLPKRCMAARWINIKVHNLTDEFNMITCYLRFRIFIRISLRLLSLTLMLNIYIYSLLIAFTLQILHPSQVQDKINNHITYIAFTWLIEPCQHHYLYYPRERLEHTLPIDSNIIVIILWSLGRHFTFIIFIKIHSQRSQQHNLRLSLR